MSDGSEALVEWVNEKKRTIVCVCASSGVAEELPIWSLKQFGGERSPLCVIVVLGDLHIYVVGEIL